MRSLGVFLILCIMVLTIGCSPIISVSYDYDKKADLAGLRTYDWLPIPSEAEERVGLMIERIKGVVNTHLEAKGLRLTKKSPDFLIASYFGQEDKLMIWSRGYPTGPYRGYYYGGPYYWGGVGSYYYQEGTLVLDFVDAESDKLIWQGTAKVSLGKEQTPEKLDKIVNEGVEMILINFPPTASK